MDALAAEAISTLTGAVSALLPAGGTPPGVLVLPQRITHAGLGDYIGQHHSPEGEVRGRRVAARVVVSVSAANASGVDTGVRDVVNALMTQGRDELARAGIVRLELLELGPRPVPAAGPPSPLVREVAFHVLYEFLKLPESAGGVIQSIPLDIDVALSGGEPRLLRRGGFQPAALTQFEPFDDPLAVTGGPGAWSFAAESEALVQSAAIRGGPNNSSPAKPGTYLTLRPTAAVPAVLDLSLAASVRALEPGGIGFVFRFIDVDNFYYVLLDSRTGFRRFGRKVAGEFAGLQEGGVDAERGFTTGALMRLRLVAREDSFRLVLDGETVLEGFDGELVEPGRVGFMTRHCTGGQFFDLTLLRL